MAVKNAMFLFEVVVDNVMSMVESRMLVIKSDFANIFSLELKDPKQMHIVMPEPLPLPPEPPGKKGKKKKPKPKPKKGKKGKKGVVEVLPPEPLIQSGQSVLFASSAEILIENMKKCPLELSLWSKEENLIFIGTTCVPWDPIFILYLEKIVKCEEPPPVVLKEEYNIFEEGRAKIMAKITIQVKLSHLNDKVTTAFRTLSEDATLRKFLYTGINSKTTSYMCTLKTSDEQYIENSNKVDNQFIVDKPKPTKIAYANYKNAPGANLTFFDEKDFCCLNHADKPPESIYKSPETCPDIDFIIDYVRKIIVSCNDNMRMLTPRPTISPRVKATDIDRLCYCRETAWPKGEFAERFKNEAKEDPCPLCIDASKKREKIDAAKFDIANIRGPCGKPECRIARHIRSYIQNLFEEDNVVFNLDDLIGPCGSKECTLAAKIQEFLRHEGVFTEGATPEGISTQCACIEKMKESLTKRTSCASSSSEDSDSNSSRVSASKVKECPNKKPIKKVFDVFYFTVEYDFENKTDKTPEDSATPDKKPDGDESDAKSTKSTKSSKYKYCPLECPSKKYSKMSCSKTVCITDMSKLNDDPASEKCPPPECPKYEYPPSPADSDVELRFDEINNPCCVKSCEIAEKIKDFIVDGVTKKQKCTKEHEDPCFCDCDCTFKFSNKTTYCAVCGGYECLGDDMRDQPEYIKPHPCPVYHKLYDKKNINVKSPWPEEDQKKETTSTKSSKAGSKSGEKSAPAKTTKVVDKKVPDKKEGPEEKVKKTKKTDKNEEAEEKTKKKETEKKKKEKKETGTTDAGTPPQVPVKKEDNKYRHYPLVPRRMGWAWTAEDVPGMKFRPNWRPGAANAVLVRRYKATRQGRNSINKKKRALMQRKKKTEMKPTLTVTKQDGEYTVQMEVFKKFSKERLVFQYPYEEKPPIVYTIGKTAEEKRMIQRKRDRKERRDSRRKSRLLQSTFRDRCQEICLKAYDQAIGLLPIPHPNAPHCPCNDTDDLSSTLMDSCSCSDNGSLSSSDTDNDEWTIEFTPPAARWDTKSKHPPVCVENESQYNYLDYKVKLLDKTGNPVPRFFKGPDGKEECSDLGGFWSPKQVWLEINKDGYIGPDNRWVPMSFTGPDGLTYSAEEGFFTDNVGQLWKIGVDGYIDQDGKWISYHKKKVAKSTKSKSTGTASSNDAKKGGKSSTDASIKGKIGDAKHKADVVGSAAATTSAKTKAIHDKKSVTATVTISPVVHKVTKNSDKGKKMMPHPEKTKNPIVMSVAVDYNRNKPARPPKTERKPYVDPKKLAKFNEIMEQLKVYDDVGELKPLKANRASNTCRKTLSPFTIQGSINNEKMRSFTGDRSYGFGSRTISSQYVESLMAKSNLK